MKIKERVKRIKARIEKLNQADGMILVNNYYTMAYLHHCAECCENEEAGLPPPPPYKPTKILVRREDAYKYSEEYAWKEEMKLCE